MAKPNYGFEKYRREEAKKKKREEKRLRKLAKKNKQPTAERLEGQPPNGDAEGEGKPEAL